MDAVKMLKTRRSCRKFEDRMLDEGLLQDILDCGLNAPSAKNQQDTKIVVVRNPAAVKALSALNARVMNSTADPFYGAPVVCLILAPKHSPNGVKDGALVIGAMQNAAYALDVGSCWINRCEEMLELPEGQAWLCRWGLTDYTGVGCCILGCPAEHLPKKEIRPDRLIQA